MAFNRKSKGEGYYQHDDRTSGNFSGRRVSFKTVSCGKINRQSRQRGWDNKIRHLLEDDVDMMSAKTNKKNTNTRYNPFRNRGGRTGSKFIDRRLPESPSNWYKITICHGKKYNRQDIIKRLQSFIQPVPFVPVSVKMEEDDMTFFVDNYKTAQSINNANLRLQMADGWKVQIKVESRMPFVELNLEMKTKIRNVMDMNYDRIDRVLNLSRFHANQEFLNDDLFVPLNRQNMLLAVFQIIAENVPNLRGLNLSNNNIFSTEHFSMLKRHAPDLEMLDLSNNKIKDLSDLNCLQGLRLKTLTLDDNPLCNKHQDPMIYVREVRKIFKQLLKLDGQDLPPPVNFDIEETQQQLPAGQGSFLCSTDGRDFTKQFLEEYYRMYDFQPNRDAIADAYAENAQFSMTAYSATAGINLNQYISESRNLKKVSHYERRTKLLHVGRAEVVRFLNTLPKTQHDLSTFTVDLTVFTPNLISLCVCGVFRETQVPPENKSAIKGFSRTFVLIPSGNGFKIVNDMLFITNPCELQLQMAFRQKPSTSAQPSVSSQVNATPAPPVNAIPVNSPQADELNQKREMVRALSMQTGMNLLWSEKCLAETSWNFNNALYAFTEFNKVGKIPAEAFTPTS